jgi:hypothetical protein
MNCLGVLTGLCLLLGGTAWAETCLTQSSPPTYTAGQPVPQVCDTHGSQKVVIVDTTGAIAALLKRNAVLYAQKLERVRQLRDAVAALELEEQRLLARLERRAPQ